MTISIRHLIALLSMLVILLFFVGVTYTSISVTYITYALVPLQLLIVSLFINNYGIELTLILKLMLLTLILMFFGTVFIYNDMFVLKGGAVAVVVVMVTSFLLAIVLYKLQLSFLFSIVTFLFIAIPSVLYILTNNTLEVDNLFVNSSRNVVSSLLIFTSCAIAASCNRKKNNIIIIPFIISAWVSLHLNTRSSILISFLLLGCVVVRQIGTRISLIAFVVMLVSIYLSGYDLINYLIKDTKFINKGFNSPRWDMLLSYINAMDYKTLFFGVDLSSVEIIASHNLNPHNSLIRFHSFFGVVPIALLLMLFIYMARSASLFYIILVLAIFARSLTDTLLFGFFYDVFFMITLIAMYVNRYEYKQ